MHIDYFFVMPMCFFVYDELPLEEKQEKVLIKKIENLLCLHFESLQIFRSRIVQFWLVAQYIIW